MSVAPTAQPELSDHGSIDQRERAAELVRALPEGASLDDIVRALAFDRMIDRGLADAVAGRVLSHQVFRQRASKWLV